MEKIYAAPISNGFYAVFIGDKKLTLPLSEADAKKLADNYNESSMLRAENAKLREALKLAYPYLKDWQGENGDDPSVGMYKDYDLEEAYLACKTAVGAAGM